MKVRDLNGNIIHWKIRGDIVAASDKRQSRSSLHKKARSILYDLFPTSQILEEVPINARPGRTQYLDFYINQIKLAVEVHGQQHFKFNTMFHASAQDFLNQKRNDADKKNWCELNNITYIELAYNEKETEWIAKIQSR
jgi:very-short-patch-repair endonuclease